MNRSDYIVYAIVLLVIGACLYVYFKDETFQLKCIVSTIDGNKYCVRERERLQDAADLLAKTAKKCEELVNYCAKNHGDNPCVKRLKSGFNPQKFMETLPTSEYTAYSENKGEKIAFCLNTEKEGNQLIDPNTLTFVAIHELAHIATKSIGHKEEFWNNFKFLLGEAGKIGIYEQVDYKKKPQRYCGTDITDNPYFDL